MPPPKCNENTYVTNHRKRKNHVIPNLPSDVGISWYTVWATETRRPWWRPVPSIPRVGKSHVSPGDSHVASLLGMTYCFTFTNISLPLGNRNVVGGGTPPALRSSRDISIYETREGQAPPLRFRIVTLYLLSTGLHHRHSLRSPHQCALLPART